MKYVGPPPKPIPSLRHELATPGWGPMRRYRWIGTPSSTGHNKPPSMPMKCPTGNAVRLSCGMLRMARVELTNFATKGLVAVHDALGVRVVARGERDQCRIRGVRVDGAQHGLTGQQFVEIASDQGDDRHVDAHVGVEVHSTEVLGGDEHLRVERSSGCNRLPFDRKSARSAPPRRRASVEAQKVAAASIEFGNWNATTSPGLTPRACRPAANRRATRSTSLNVPVYGRTSSAPETPTEVVPPTRWKAVHPASHRSTSPRTRSGP